MNVKVFFVVVAVSLSVTELVPGPEAVTPIAASDPHQMPLLMQLYNSPDYRSPLDPNAKVQSDKRIYAEVGNRSPYVHYCTSKIQSLLHFAALG